VPGSRKAKNEKNGLYGKLKNMTFSKRVLKERGGWGGSEKRTLVRNEKNKGVTKKKFTKKKKKKTLSKTQKGATPHNNHNKKKRGVQKKKKRVHHIGGDQMDGLA